MVCSFNEPSSLNIPLNPSILWVELPEGWKPLSSYIQPNSNVLVESNKKVSCIGLDSSDAGNVGCTVVVTYYSISEVSLSSLSPSNIKVVSSSDVCKSLSNVEGKLLNEFKKVNSLVSFKSLIFTTY